MIYESLTEGGGSCLIFLLNLWQQCVLVSLSVSSQSVEKTSGCFFIAVVESISLTALFVHLFLFLITSDRGIDPLNNYLGAFSFYPT